MNRWDLTRVDLSAIPQSRQWDDFFYVQRRKDVTSRSLAPPSSLLRQGFPSWDVTGNPSIITKPSSAQLSHRMGPPGLGIPLSVGRKWPAPNQTAPPGSSQSGTDGMSLSIIPGHFSRYALQKGNRRTGAKEHFGTGQYA